MSTSICFRALDDARIAVLASPSADLRRPPPTAAERPPPSPTPSDAVDQFKFPVDRMIDILTFVR
ncbi:MAG: hypothetical protein WCH98_21735 [Verrucomicrobiota bacterium]